MQYKTPVITTPRLTLRAPILTDIEAFQAAKEEVWDDLQNWMSWSSDEQKTIEATKDFFQKTQTDGSSILLGVDPTTDDFIIATGIDVLGPDEYSTGYWVSKKYLGQGYATEACNAILRYIFATRQVKAVHIDHFEGNDKSENVIRKLGFLPQGVTPKAHRQLSSGNLLDVYHYTRRDAAGLPDLEVVWR